MYAAAGQCFCYVIITICIRYNEDLSISFETRRQWAKGSIAFFFLYYVFFGIGWQGVPWVGCRIGCMSRTDQVSFTLQRSTLLPCVRKVLLWEQVSKHT